MENKFDKILLKLINTLISLLLAFMFVIVIISIFFRYIINFPIFWAEEFARYIMFYMVMLGSALAFREKKHPALLFVVQKFPIRFLKVWNFTKDIIIIIILIIIFKEGYLMALNEVIMKSPALRISFFWIYLAFPIGALLMISQIIARYIFEKKSFRIK